MENLPIGGEEIECEELLLLSSRLSFSEKLTIGDGWPLAFHGDRGLLTLVEEEEDPGRVWRLPERIPLTVAPSRPSSLPGGEA